MKRFVHITDVPAWLDNATAYFNLYSVETDRSIYIISDAKDIVGFALVNKAYRYIHAGNTVAEFYIKPEKQKQGFGVSLAEYTFSQHRDRWEVCVMSNNRDAKQFWQKTIANYTRNHYETQHIASYDGTVFTFNANLANSAL